MGPDVAGHGLGNFLGPQSHRTSVWTIGSRHPIPTVGELNQFADNEGNEAINAQHIKERLIELGFG